MITFMAFCGFVCLWHANFFVLSERREDLRSELEHGGTTTY